MSPWPTITAIILSAYFDSNNPTDEVRIGFSAGDTGFSYIANAALRYLLPIVNGLVLEFNNNSNNNNNDINIIIIIIIVIIINNDNDNDNS